MILFKLAYLVALVETAIKYSLVFHLAFEQLMTFNELFIVPSAASLSLKLRGSH